VKCMICDKLVGWGGLCISLVDADIYTVNLCQSCRHKLLGPEVDERVTRLCRRLNWVQPRLSLG